MELKDGTLLFFDDGEESWTIKWESSNEENEFFAICSETQEKCVSNLDWLKNNYRIYKSSSLFIMEVTKTEPKKPPPLKFKRIKG